MRRTARGLLKEKHLVIQERNRGYKEHLVRAQFKRRTTCGFREMKKATSGRHDPKVFFEKFFVHRRRNIQKVCVTSQVDGEESWFLWLMVVRGEKKSFSHGGRRKK